MLPDWDYLAEVRGVVDQAPPLSADQRDRLVAIFASAPKWRDQSRRPGDKRPGARPGGARAA